MSSRGFMVDMIDSIGEKTALSSHIREKIESGKDIDKNKEILKKVLFTRRQQMNRLLEEAEKADPDYWCDFKHSVKSWVQDAEIYEATLSDKDLEVLNSSSEILAMEISCFLGMEFETCARCIFDRLLVQQYEKQHSDIIKSNNKGDENGKIN